jgi:hypothetical protein
MTLKQLNELCAELLDSDSENSAILAAMPDEELQQAMCDAMRQFGLELLIGAEEKSTWMSELLVIGANLGPILDCQAAFRASLFEMSRRNLDPPDVVIGCQ